MRRKDKEITDPEIIKNLMENSEICRIGLVDNGEAYIVPVNYAYKDGTIFIHSASNGRKIEVLKQNNKVAFEVEGNASIVTGDKACEWTTRYRSVMGKGTIIIETNALHKREALELIMRKYGWNKDEISFDEALLSRVCILNLSIETMTGKQSGDWQQPS